MKINYKHDEGRCMTPCPYGILWRNEGEREVLLVGSNACAACDHFVFNDETADWVECGYEENIWQLAKESLDQMRGETK